MLDHYIKQMIEKRVFALTSNIHTLDLIDQTPQTEYIKYIPTKILVGAISFELIIKIFYSLENNINHPKNHKISSLYDQLNSETKTLIKKAFDDTVVKTTKDWEKQIGEKLYIPNFEKILLQNETIITKFKYDSKIQNGSIVNTNFIKSLLIEIRSRNT